jgi:hypothetical protein
MSANQGKLKTGQLCWMTKTAAFNIGKIVEVVDLCQTFEGLDYYHVMPKQPILCWDDLGNMEYVTKEFHAARDQLIPFNDPDQDLSDEEKETLKNLSTIQAG